MSERDWIKDLELCQQANDELRVLCRSSSIIGPYIPLSPGATLTSFFWQALQGWPAALEERARLEARVRELEAQIAVMRDALGEFTDSHNTVWPFKNGEADVGQYGGYFRALERAEEVLNSSDVGKGLLEENRRLRAVAELGKKLVSIASNPGDMPAWSGTWPAFKEALKKVDING